MNDDKKEKNIIKEFIEKYKLMQEKLNQVTNSLNDYKKKSEDYYMKIQELETINRKFELENNTLNINYFNLKKRFNQLQKNLEDIKNKLPENSIFNYFTGGGIKEQNEEMKKNIEALEKELTLKIQENEECHIRLFELKEKYEKLNEDYKTKLDEFNKIKLKDENQIKDLMKINKDLLHTITESEDRNKQNKKQLEELIINNDKNIEEISRLNSELQKLENKSINNCNYDIKLLSNNLQYNTNVNYKEILNNNIIRFFRIFFCFLKNFEFFNNYIERIIDVRISLYNSEKKNKKEMMTNSETIKDLIKLFKLFKKILIEKVELKNITQTNKNIIKKFDVNAILYINILLLIVDKIYDLLFSIYSQLKLDSKNTFNNEVYILNLFNEVKLSLISKIQNLIQYNSMYNNNNIDISKDKNSLMNISINSKYFKNFQFNDYDDENQVQNIAIKNNNDAKKIIAELKDIKINIEIVNDKDNKINQNYITELQIFIDLFENFIKSDIIILLNSNKNEIISNNILTNFLILEIYKNNFKAEENIIAKEINAIVRTENFFIIEEIIDKKEINIVNNKIENIDSGNLLDENINLMKEFYNILIGIKSIIDSYKNNLKNKTSTDTFNQCYAKIIFFQKMLEKFENQLESIKNVFSEKEKNYINEIENLKKEIEESKNNKLKEINDNNKNLKEKINQKNDIIQGYLEQITFLSESLTKYETAKDSFCKKCKSLIKD